MAGGQEEEIKEPNPIDVRFTLRPGIKVFLNKGSFCQKPKDPPNLHGIDYEIRFEFTCEGSRRKVIEICDKSCREESNLPILIETTNGSDVLDCKDGVIQFKVTLLCDRTRHLESGSDDFLMLKVFAVSTQDGQRQTVSTICFERDDSGGTSRDHTISAPRIAPPSQNQAPPQNRALTSNSSSNLNLTTVQSTHADQSSPKGVDLHQEDETRTDTSVTFRASRFSDFKEIVFLSSLLHGKSVAFESRYKHGRTELQKYLDNIYYGQISNPSQDFDGIDFRLMFECVIVPENTPLIRCNNNQKCRSLQENSKNRPETDSPFSVDTNGNDILFCDGTISLKIRLNCRVEKHVSTKQGQFLRINIYAISDSSSHLIYTVDFVHLEVNKKVLEAPKGELVGMEEKQIEDRNNPKQAETPSIYVDMKELIVDENNVLGRGGFGIVYKGTYQAKPIAVKQIWKEARTEKIKLTLEAEIETMRKLEDLNIVKFIGITNGFGIVLEFCDNGSLWSILHDQRVNKILSIKEVMNITQAIASGLAYLHKQRIIHHDIKSPNILLDRNMTAKIGDFGLSKTKAFTSEMTNDRSGTLAYFAPEILAGEPHNIKADVYSFAIVVCEMLSNEEPWEGLPQVTLFAKVKMGEERPKIDDRTPKKLAELISACWHQDPDQRPRMADVVTKLREIADKPAMTAFYGNPGAGKSTLLNIIIRRLEFPSGLAVSGLTKEWKTYTFDGMIYADTPGLDDASSREEAAKQIEASLKTSNRYKIIFVAAPTASRIANADLTTINTVCDAIKIDFEYGLILNKISPNVEKKLQSSQLEIDALLKQLHKPPLEVLLMPEVADLRDADDVLLKDNNIRDKLMNFINKFKAVSIPEEEVEHVDVRSFEDRVKDMEVKIKREHEEEIRKLREEEEARWGEGIKSVEEEFKTEEGNQIEKTSEERVSKWKRDSVYITHTMVVPWTKYRRMKTTRNNNSVEYSEWQVHQTGERAIGTRETKRIENERWPF